MKLNVVLDETDQSHIMLKRLDFGYRLDPKENMKILKKLQPQCESDLDCVWFFIKTCMQKIENKSKDPLIGLQTIVQQNNKQMHNSKNINEWSIFGHFVTEDKDTLQILKQCQWTCLKMLGDDKTSQSQQQKGNFPDLDLICNTLEAKGQYYRSAAIAGFHFDFTRSLLALKNASEKQKTGNECVFMKTILQGLSNIQIYIKNNPKIKKYFYIKQKKSKIGEDQLAKDSEIQKKVEDQQNHFNFLISLCQQGDFQNPYLKSLAKFLSNKKTEEWSQILNETGVNFFDQIAFASRFLMKKTLTEMLEEIVEGSILGMDKLQTLILVGKSKLAAQIMQNYIDKTGDLQTVALLSVYFNQWNFPDLEKYQQWIYQYMQILDELQKYEERINLDRRIYELQAQFKKHKGFTQPKNLISRNKSQITNMDYRIYETCAYCKIALGHELMQKNRQLQTELRYKPNPKSMINGCPKCSNSLPKCAICLMPQYIKNPAKQYQHGRGQRKQNKPEMMELNEGFVWCQMCRHDGHAQCLMEWFSENDTCPVSDCNCQCINL